MANSKRMKPPVRTFFAVKLYVAPSGVHGKGLFAGERIEAGRHILTWGGQIFSGDEVRRGVCEPHTAIRIGEDEWLGEVAGAERDAGDFINHSCAPNVGLDGPFNLVAISQIDKDEELTADYSTWLDDGSYASIMSCRCSQTRCRHSVSGTEWRDPAFARLRYMHLSPYVRALVDRYGILR